jgi:hypothetical protein
MDFSKDITTIAGELQGASLDELAVSSLITTTGHKIEVTNSFQKEKWYTGITYLLQDKLSGHNVCPWATDSCREVCLGTHSGHARMIKGGNKTNHVQAARLKRTIMYFNFREEFLNGLRKELNSLVRKAEKKGVKPAFRFNGSSDLSFEKSGIMEEYPNIMFYDYTKSFHRMTNFLDGDLPENYHLTFSYTPENEDKASLILAMGGNVAVVFDERSTTKHAPTFIGRQFLGHEIITGDEHDLRFLDPKGGYVVGLTKKGHQKNKAFFISVDRTTKAAEAA